VGEADLVVPNTAINRFLDRFRLLLNQATQFHQQTNEISSLLSRAEKCPTTEIFELQNSNPHKDQC
jgi:hypothetical protein